MQELERCIVLQVTTGYSLPLSRLKLHVYSRLFIGFVCIWFVSSSCIVLLLIPRGNLLS